MTALVGRSCIAALNRRIARQAVIERQPDEVRRQDLGYDIALGRLAKGLCPGCERPVDLEGADTSFCPHCGIGLFGRCSGCGTRKTTLAPFCRTPAAA